MFTLKVTFISVMPSNIKAIAMIFTAFMCLKLLILIVNFVTLALTKSFIKLRLAVKFTKLVMIKVNNSVTYYRPHLMVQFKLLK